MVSIKQNPRALLLPDFRNFGVMLRVLLGVNLMVAAGALAQGRGLIDAVGRFVDDAAWVQPLLLANVLTLALINPFLHRLPYRVACAVVLALAVVSALVFVDFWRFMDSETMNGASLGGRLWRAALLAGGLACALLYYFALRARAFSPALAEARLQALTARIRPHFLFNSLNAVVSLIRAEPRRAESALEELADLFRALMREHRDMLPLADEIALCRQYLDLEKLRLGERLNVEWEVADVPADLKVPPLMLQPLLENAVYHGIEPSPGPGVIRIRFARRGDELLIELANPCPEASASASAMGSGAHMALANIRERLSLYYDLEARLETREASLADGRREYRVNIVLPCRGGPS